MHLAEQESATAGTHDVIDPAILYLGTPVDRLALTTGANPMSDFKKANGYRCEPDKFAVAGLTPASSITVAPERVAECPVNLEATLVGAPARRR